MAENEQNQKKIPPGMVITGRVDSVNKFQGKEKVYHSVDINAPGSGTITVKLPEGIPFEYEIDERYAFPVRFRLADYGKGRPPVPEFHALAAGVRR